MSRFFIDRPILAWVIAVGLMFAGVLSIRVLPVSQYPSIAPTTISINATYSGASAETVESSVTQVIEGKMSGLDRLNYISASSSSAGTATITLTFEAGTNPDIAQVQVQNKLQQALPGLPSEVQRAGVRVSKTSASFLMLLGFVSEDGAMTDIDIGNYVADNVQNVVSRIDGVGAAELFGSQYAMRIWLRPERLHSYGLMPVDVRLAIVAQNTQVSVGELGALPAVPGQRLNATVTAQSRLRTPEEFGNIILRAAADGSMVRLRDVARIEIGGDSYGVSARYNGQPAVGMSITLASGANALNTADAVKSALTELERTFPHGLKVVYPYDTTPFVRISIIEVVKTLIEAIGLVFLVMFLFLQSFRATIIPTIAIPVVLLGTFAILAAFGFSINTQTMFAMVLAIGLLVDDAIVVVENVERLIEEEGLSPREATIRSMRQISGALVAIGLVLSAVFVPMAFFGGSTGVIYRQFSITIIAAMALSVLVALVLTPALCATLLKPVKHGAASGKSRGLFGLFNRGFDATKRGYTRVTGGLLRRTVRSLAVYVLIVVAMGMLYVRIPTAFLPDEDQGFMFVQMQLPTGATQERTLAVAKDVEAYFLNEKESVASLFTIIGFSFGGSAQNTGLGFIRLRDWDERERPDLGVFAIAQKAMGALSRIRDGLVFAFAPPAVLELGNVSGFDLQLVDQGGVGRAALLAARDQFLAAAAKDPTFLGVRPAGQEDTPQFRIDVDLPKARALGLDITAINDTISSAWGGSYVNDFVYRGRVKKVLMQADASARMAPEDLDKWYVRNESGGMVPFSAFATSHWTVGSPRLERYNGMNSIQLMGQPAPGVSTGNAMAVVERIAQTLPLGIGYQWTGLSYQEKQAGGQALMLYGISAIAIFMCLAALYESWSVPISVLLVIPLGVVGAVLAADWRGLANDVYFQVGLLTTSGLATKNAILIVEFAKEQVDKGRNLFEATLEAATMRLRPILMTSLAFILGVLPLAISTGPGSGSQHAVGTGVMGGMVSATVLAVFLVPVFFVVVWRLFASRSPAAVDAVPVSVSAAAAPVARPEH